MSELAVFTDKNFDEEIVHSDKPVLVYVTTRWCRPGRDLTSIIEQVAEEIQGKVKVGALDADVERQFVRVQQVRSVPTVLLFKGGKPGARLTGRFSKLQLMGQISALLVEDESNA